MIIGGRSPVIHSHLEVLGEPEADGMKGAFGCQGITVARTDQGTLQGQYQRRVAVHVRSRSPGYSKVLQEAMSQG